ncbi:MAG TPA: tetratricopeptide repeat protein [Chthoniobacteraceae bacterium]|nr:tetratricopeptide repeat protein [Chthoniobacteraceae bacterium]
MRTLLLAMALSFRCFAEDPQVSAHLQRGDAEERRGHPRAALACYRLAEERDPKNIAVLLRIAKQYSDLIAQTKPESAARVFADRSLEYSQRAVAIDPKSAKGHLSLAVAYGRLTDFVGNKVKMDYSRLIKEEAVRSIELDPTDDFAWHVLGRWHSGVANVGSMLKAMARVAYGGLPPATNEDAAKCLKKAVELAPQRIIHHSELARVYQTMGRKELAKKEWQAVLALPALDKEDEKDKREAQAVIGAPLSTPARSAAR